MYDSVLAGEVEQSRLAPAISGCLIERRLVQLRRNLREPSAHARQSLDGKDEVVMPSMPGGHSYLVEITRLHFAFCS